MVDEDDSVGQGNDDRAAKPPYVSFVTFKNFIGGLKGHLPSEIDTSLMSNHAGGTQSQLMLALRWLGLVEGEKDHTSPDLRELVDSHDTVQWSAKVKKLIVARYEPITGDINLDSATPAQVEGAFRDKGGAKGSVNNKAIRFYLKAREEAGMTYSKHLGKRRQSGGNSGRRRTAKKQTTKKQETGYTGNDSQEQVVPEGMISYPIHFKTRSEPGQIIIHGDITKAEVKMIKAAVAMIELYADDDDSDDE